MYLKYRLFIQNFEYIFFVFNFYYLLFTNSTILEIAFVASGIGKAGYTWFKFLPIMNSVLTFASRSFSANNAMSGYNSSRVPENNNTSGKPCISPYNGETFHSDKSASPAQDLASASKVSTCS